LHQDLSEMEMLAAQEIRNRLHAMGVRVDSLLPTLAFCDMAIFFGTAKFRPKFSHLVKLFITYSRMNFMVFESPVIGRVTQELGHKEPFFRVGMGGFFADRGFDYALTHQNDSTAKRLLMGDAFSSPQVRFNGNGVVGIALQIPGDTAIKGVDQILGTEAVIAHIRNSNYFCNARITVRTPPLLAFRKDQRLARLEAIPGVDIQTGTNDNKEDFFRSIELLVTFSSTMGVDAISRGVPACGLDPRSFLRLVSHSGLDNLLNRRMQLNPNYLNILANTTWKIENIFGSEFLRVVMGVTKLDSL